MRKQATKNKRRGVYWGLIEGLKDLDFADDIPIPHLVAQRYTDIQAKLSSLQREPDELIGSKMGPRPNKSR